MTALLFHAVSSERLQQLLSFNEDFLFDGRYLVNVEVTDFVKLLQRGIRNRLPSEVLRRLQSWITKEFAAEELRVRMVSCGDSQ